VFLAAVDLNIDQESAVETRAMEILETLRLVTTMLVLSRQFGDPGQVGRLAVDLAVAAKERDREAAPGTLVMEVLEILRLATTKLVLSHQFGDPGRAGPLVVDLAVEVKKRDHEAAPDRPALAERKIQTHATRSNARRWNLGATGLRAIVALKSERELGTAHDRIHDLSVQKNSNSSKTAPARLKHHQSSLHRLRRRKRQPMKLSETSQMTSMRITRVENAFFSTLMETAWTTLNMIKATKLLI